MSPTPWCFYSLRFQVSDRQAAMIKVESSRKKQGKEVERKRLQGRRCTAGGRVVEIDLTMEDE